jgi:polysaccharide export outer membrane protein
MKSKLLALLLAVALCIPAFAQVKLDEIKNLRGASNLVIKAAKIEIPDKKAFVMLNPDYPITPGDVYTIQYLYNLKPTTLPFFVESDYTMNLSFFGKLNAKGMNFRELKVVIEKLVLKAYPDSLPRLVIESVGAFPVLVKGEVKVPGYAQAWGFSRLTDVIDERLTSYSSIRDIEIVSDSGEAKRYDLYQAALTSDLTKNPIVHPGDVVVLNRLEREVFIKGEVHREGAFQLLPGEDLRTVVEQYAGGLTDLADAANAYIMRFLSAEGTTDTVYLDLSKQGYNDVELHGMDLIVVPGRINKLPLVFFEGALFMKPGTTSPISAKIPWPITKDQRVSTALANLPEGAITPISDLERASIVHKGSGTFTHIDLDKIYYNHDLSGDVVLEEGDRIIIPTKLFGVAVAGAVHSPGLQPYVAGKTYLEYIQLAGGVDPELTTGKGIKIIDRDGKMHTIDRVIQPEDKIYVPKNHPIYLFTNRLGPIIVTLAAITSMAYNLSTAISYFK